MKKIITAYRASRMKQYLKELAEAATVKESLTVQTEGKGKRLYYAFLHGYDRPETFGTIAELNTLLEAIN